MTIIRRAWVADEDEVFYLYLTDQEGLLSGLVPLKRLLLAVADAPVGTLANRSPIAVRSDMDQEEIAYIFAEYDLLVLPVVDDYDAQRWVVAAALFWDCGVFLVNSARRASTNERKFYWQKARPDESEEAG